MILNRGDNECLDRHHSYRVLSAEEVAAGKTTHWPELEINGSIRNLSPSIWKLTHLTALYLNDNSLARIPSAISLLPHLRRLDLTSNKLRSLPAEIGDLIQLRELMLGNNYLRQLPYELGKLFQLMILGLKGNPLTPEIFQLYNEHNGTRKLLEFMLDNLHVNASPPPPRPWVPLAHLDRSRPCALFTVMCYNVLCDRYATRQMYGYCPQWALNWEYRKKGILDEVRHYGADLVTLQEVETDQFYNFFYPELARDGYEGVFSPKSRAKTMNECDRKHVDGCAIFFKTAKFKLIKEHLVEFNQVAMAHAEGSDVMLNRVMTKDNIALAVLLETKESCYDAGVLPEASQLNQLVLVTTAHIHWDPEFCDVKLIQTMMLVDQIKRVIEESSLALRPGQKYDPSSIQLLLCGDFNSLPESGVVEYLQEGHIRVDHKDFKDLSYKRSLCKMISHSANEESYTHTFRLSSAVTQDIMPFTNYTYDFKGMIDYIFYPRNSMRPLGVLGPVDSNWLKENKVVGCPHPHLTSDHFSLLVELAMPLPLGAVNSPSSAVLNLSASNAPAPAYPVSHQQPQMHVQPQPQQQQQHLHQPPVSNHMNNMAVMSYPPPMQHHPPNGGLPPPPPPPHHLGGAMPR